MLLGAFAGEAETRLARRLSSFGRTLPNSRVRWKMKQAPRRKLHWYESLRAKRPTRLRHGGLRSPLPLPLIGSQC